MARASSKAPTAEIDLLISPECRPQNLQRKMLRHFQDNSQELPEAELWSEFERIVQSHFDDCGDELKRQPSLRLLDYSEMSSLEYEFDEHPQFQNIEFQIPGKDRVVKAKLGLKPGEQKRPLVIFQCGMACQPGTFTSHFATMIFFDMGPFHVLLLPSNSSEAFIKPNKTLALGGLEEGQQIVHIAKQIMAPESKLSKHVSRIHVHGISLGGHSTYFAALFGQHLSSPNSPSLISGAAVGCPVVDLEPSLDHMASGALIPKILRMTILRDFTQLLAGIPFFQQWGRGPLPEKPTGEELQLLVKEGVFDHYRSESVKSDWALPPFEDVAIHNKNDLWDANDVSQWPEGLLRRPVFSWAPSDDEIVPFDINSQKLYSVQRSYAERQVFKLKTERGGHCVFAADFGWGTASAMLNGVFLAQSPELIERIRESRRVLTARELRSLGWASARKQRESITLQASPKSSYVKVVSIFKEFPCRRVGRQSGGVCRSTKSAFLPLSYFGMKNSEMPQTAIQAQALSRRLNIRSMFYDRYGRPVSATENPVSIGTIQY